MQWMFHEDHFHKSSHIYVNCFSDYPAISKVTDWISLSYKREIKYTFHTHFNHFLGPRRKNWWSPRFQIFKVDISAFMYIKGNSDYASLSWVLLRPQFIHQIINGYPVDNCNNNKPCYLLDNDLTSGWFYPPFEQSRPEWLTAVE